MDPPMNQICYTWRGQCVERVIFSIFLSWFSRALRKITYKTVKFAVRRFSRNPAVVLMVKISRDLLTTVNQLPNMLSLEINITNLTHLNPFWLGPWIQFFVLRPKYLIYANVLATPTILKKKNQKLLLKSFKKKCLNFFWLINYSRLFLNLYSYTIIYFLWAHHNFQTFRKHCC